MPTDKQVLMELAEECERHADHHFTIAYVNSSASPTTVDLHNIDRGLECLERADRLRARSQENSNGD